MRETARALTGWRQFDVQNHLDQLVPEEFDDGPKTILGATGNWGLDDVVRLACLQPAAATHIAHRLYRTFVSNTDRASPELIAPLAAAMRADGDVLVSQGIELVLRSRLFHSPECRTRRVKSPVDLAIGVIRGARVV